MEGVFFGLTSASEIRAQLGSGEEEFADDYIESLGLADELKLDLLSWFPNFQALTDESSNDVAVVSQQLAMKSYARAFCAFISIPTIRMRFVQKKADGDNQASRFQNKDSINDLQDDLRLKVASMKAKVLSFTTSHSPADEVTTYATLGVGISTPASDVITG